MACRTLRAAETFIICKLSYCGKATIPEGVTLLHLEYDVAPGLQPAGLARGVLSLSLSLSFSRSVALSLRGRAAPRVVSLLAVP